MRIISTWYLIIVEKLEELLRKPPAQGLLFPHLRTTTASARSAECCRRRHVSKIKGVSLHRCRELFSGRNSARFVAARVSAI